MLLKDFKNSVNTVIEQSNSYLEWADEFNALCQKYELGTCGEDVFHVVYNELENRLRAEKMTHIL